MIFSRQPVGKGPDPLFFFRKRQQKTVQPNRLLLTATEKLVNLRVLRTDWALRGVTLGGSFFTGCFSCSFFVALLACLSVGLLVQLPRLIETFQLNFCVISHPLSEFRSIDLGHLHGQCAWAILDLC